MKQCVLTGGGSKFGAHLTNSFLEKNYHVHLITSNGNNWQNRNNVTVIDVDWKNLDISGVKNLIPVLDYADVILFNHNASALNAKSFAARALQNPRDWQRSYFVACQFPYYFVHMLSKKLSADSKIGWMLSELISHPTPDQTGFADYIGNKFTNACIMKSFSDQHPSCFFGLHPDGGVEASPSFKAKSMAELIDTYDVNFLNGKIFDSQGQLLNIF